MKAFAFLSLLAVAVLTVCFVATTAAQQENLNDLFQQYVEKFGPPGPEHRQLEPLVGTWQASCKMWADPGQPPHTSEGILVRKPVLGGRFIHEDFDGKMHDKPFQGHGSIGFDRAKKKFVTSWMDSMSTALHVSYGTYDDSAKTWTFNNDEVCPITGKRVKMRDTLRIVSPTEQQMVMYRQLGDEKEIRMMEIDLKRTK